MQHQWCRACNLVPGWMPTTRMWWKQRGSLLVADLVVLHSRLKMLTMAMPRTATNRGPMARRKKSFLQGHKGINLSTVGLQTQLSAAVGGQQSGVWISALQVLWCDSVVVD